MRKIKSAEEKKLAKDKAKEKRALENAARTKKNKLETYISSTLLEDCADKCLSANIDNTNIRISYPMNELTGLQKDRYLFDNEFLCLLPTRLKADKIHVNLEIDEEMHDDYEGRGYYSLCNYGRFIFECINCKILEEINLT